MRHCCRWCKSQTTRRAVQNAWAVADLDVSWHPQADIVPPCYIGKDVVISNSVIGPHVSVGAQSEITGSIIENTIIQEKVLLSHVNIKDSMIGNHSSVKAKQKDLSVGDYTTMDI